MDCLFCTLQDTAKTSILYENDHWFAIYDKYPVTRGHALCILKRHTESVFSLNHDESAALCHALIEIRKVIEKENSPKAYNIAVNDGREAGRTIDHVHVHLIPRYGKEQGALRELPSREEVFKQQSGI